MFETIMPRSLAGDYLPNFLLHLRDVLVAQFEARSAGTLDVDDELAGIRPREICPPEKGKKSRKSERLRQEFRRGWPQACKIARFTATTYSSSIR